MIAVDTNVLVYAHRADAPFHAAAAGRVAGLAEGAAAWTIPWPCLHEFLAIGERLYRRRRRFVLAASDHMLLITAAQRTEP